VSYRRPVEYTFAAPLWVHQGEAGWHFVTVPPEVGEDIADRTAGSRRGFGSVRVAVTVGGTRWRTSIFPDAGSGSFLLPVKRSVRIAESLEAGDVVEAKLEVVPA
jgi:hypothetical protein